MIPFGEWLPDLPPLDNPGATVATNALPGIISYLEARNIAPQASALAAACEGAFSARDSDGNIYTYAGTSTKMYVLASGTWTEVTSLDNVSATAVADYGTDSETRWQFVQWGDKVLATRWWNGTDTNGTTKPMEITMGGANFDEMITDETTLRAKVIAIVKDFVVLGYIHDGSQAYSNRVQWSQINDNNKFAISTENQSDYQDLQGNMPDIQAIVGGEFGTVFTRGSIWRMTYVGTPLVFQFDRVYENLGTQFPYSIINVGADIYFLGTDGFKVLYDGVQKADIGKNKVDGTILNDIEASYFYNVVGAVDHVDNLVYWMYPGSGNVGGTANKLVAYNWATRRWSGPIEIECEHIFSSLSESVTVDSDYGSATSLDTVSIPVDSNQWEGGSQILSGFNTSHQMGPFAGTALTAMIETGEYAPDPNGRVLLRYVRPIVDGGSASVQIAHRTRQQDTYKWTGSYSVNADGFAPMRVNDRYLRARVKIAGGFDHAIGIEPDPVGVGKK